MKRFRLATIIGFVLTALAAAPAQAECDCDHFEALQIELRNAIRLQKAFRGKIADLRTLNHPTSLSEYKRFAENDARRGLEPVPGYEKLSKADQALLQFDFVPRGFALDDPTHPPATMKDADLCRPSDSATREFKRVKDVSACAGIGAALQAHEDVHTQSCRRRFVDFFGMNGAQRAQDEVKAYGAQISVLRNEIKKVLEGANVRIESQANIRMQMLPPNPMYTAVKVNNRAKVPIVSAPASGGDMIKLEGEGEQMTNATIEGNCRFTSGLPYRLTVRGSIETDGLDAQIHYAVEGTAPSIAMQCTLGGRVAGAGMSIPVNLSGGNVPDVKLPLKNGAGKDFDMAIGEAARILAQGGLKLSGQGKISLIFCEK